MADNQLEDLLRSSAPQVLGALVRRYGHFGEAEDAVQEALLAAATQWPRDGFPDQPRAWLLTVASRRLTDLLRAEQTRRAREERVAIAAPAAIGWAPPADAPARPVDDSLILLFLCCHEVLSPASQIALTLRAVAGLTTAEVARAFLVPEATMARRITRAKESIRAAGASFRLPPPDERPARLAAVLHVLYLLYNEGYVATSGARLSRVELSAEAIRLTRLVRAQLPHDSEVAGLLALMLLTDARRSARTGKDGVLIPMAEQDRARWDGASIAEGVALVSAALPRGPVGPYQVQAAIAALHDEAPTAEATDWPQIVALYGVLRQLADGPVVALNEAVAVSMVDGPEAGLRLVTEASADGRLAGDHRVDAVRAHLWERAGDLAAARAAYQAAASRTGSEPQRRYLLGRAARLPDVDRR